jgi:hypothetical protein
VFTKKIALAAREGTTLIPPAQRVCDALPSDYAMSVDCTEIVRLIVSSKQPPISFAGTFIEGFVVIDSWSFDPACQSPVVFRPVDIDVVAVTTSAALPNPNPFFGFDVDGPHHEVTVVQGKQLPAGIWLH